LWLTNNFAGDWILQTGVKMRCFIAVNINEYITAKLGEVARRIMSQCSINQGDVKWVDPKVMHLTLKFLGDIPNERSVDVCNAVESACEKHDIFEIEIAGVGCFGGRSARVLWVGTERGSEQLGLLAADIDEQLAEAGFSPENRKFNGHLTLGRVKNFAAGVKLANICEQQEYKKFNAGTCFVDSVTVYQSELTQTGPVYTVVGNYILSK